MILFTGDFGLDLLKEHRTINEIASAYDLHPTMVSSWKRKAIDGLEDIFKDQRNHNHRKEDAREAKLMQKIGQLSVELDWLKKKTGL